MKIKAYFIFTLALLFIGVSCNQEEFLTEKPKDFLSPDNSFVNKTSFESALGALYQANRSQFYTHTDSWTVYDLMGIGLDVAFFHRPSKDNYVADFNWETFNADAGFASKWWRFFYKQIFNANVIIGRADGENVTWSSEAERNAIVGEARFLRAYYYRFLANMYGGVPLILEETTAPRFDYVRASREAVYLQCKEDLTYATQWMPEVDDIPGGRAPRAAAYHILSEVNIQLKDYPAAIAAASAVIDGSSFHLMTQRFGKFKDFKWRGYDYTGPFEPWGDVYFDLFREYNFNRNEGNMENIWNIQLEYNTIGGVVGGGADGRFGMERWFSGGAIYWVADFFTDLNGVRNLFKDTLQGRNLGTGAATEYMSKQVWNYKGDWDRDIRNSKYNIQRIQYWNNPESEFFGQPVSKETLRDPAVWENAQVTCPSFKKVNAALHHGVSQQDGVNSDNGRTFKDWYIIRLAETYLLRAEAYHLNNENGKAAADINAVRNRAHATPVVAADVDLDLILDERARELYTEEYRIVTLLRMGKLVEYLNKYNPQVILKGSDLDNHFNLMPIPNSEIEKNRDAVLDQNPGY